MKLRAFAKKPIFVAVTSALVAGLIRLVKRTSSTVYEPLDLHAEVGAHQPFILAMWHGQFMMLAALNTPDFNVSAIVSRHGDGDLTAATLKRFGIGLIRGAGAGQRKKDRGGAYAFRAALEALNRGSIVAITADVPTAQPRIAGKGIVTLARLSGRPIIPVAAATSRFLTLNTWSRMTINLPFSKLVFVAGEPLFVPANADERILELARRKVERSLDAVAARAHALAGAKVPQAVSAGSPQATQHPAE
jgi:3-deoxy-D-manno-octulosonic-acid transferase